MKTLYVTENGLQLKKRSNRIVIKKGGKITREIRTNELKRVLIFGNTQITTELMRFLAGKGVEVAFLSTYGKFRYRLVPEMTKNIYLRMAQHDRYRDQEFRKGFAREIVKAKIKNQRVFLIRYQRNRSDLDFSKEIDELKKSMVQADTMKTIHQIMGVEGNAGRIYFQCYGKLLLNGFTFQKREYHPPPDPVNAMLGFGYMLVFNEISSLLEASGFDVYLGYLHDLKYGRKSLVSDLVEELRSPITDRLVLYLINKGIVNPSQFTTHAKGVKMDDAARKHFLANYENFMTAEFQDANRKTTSFREVIRQQVKAFEDVVINSTTYKAFTLYS